MKRSRKVSSLIRKPAQIWCVRSFGGGGGGQGSRQQQQSTLHLGSTYNLLLTQFGVSSATAL